MTNKYCIIYHDPERMKIEKSTNIIKLLKKIIIVFKKILELIDELQTLILKFSNDIFNAVDNVKYIKQSLFNSIKALYDNIVILLNSQFETIQIINFTTDNIIPIGYTINFINSLQHINVVKNNELDKEYLNPGSTINITNSLLYINSFRVLFSDVGVIKIIEYNNNIEPVSVNFLGTHISEINVHTLDDKLSKCFNNNLNTINHVKIICLDYIQKVNYLQKILK
jgi:hypothetical protein